MLVEIEKATIWKRTALRWLLSPPKYSLQLTSERSKSISVDVSRKDMVRIGLVLETEDNLAHLIIQIGEQQELYALKKEFHTAPQGRISLLLKTRKYKGYIVVRVSDTDYFSFYEKQNLPNMFFSRFSSGVRVINNLSTRMLYNGETYTVDLTTMATYDYAPILNNREVFTAHTSAKTQNEASVEREEQTEESILLAKIRGLRSSPNMFISVFSYIVIEIKRSEALEMLYRIYTDTRLRRQLHRRVSVSFIGEIGEDHGALRKEMFEVSAARLVEDKRFCLENGRFNLTPKDELDKKKEYKTVLCIQDAEFYSFVGFFLGYVIFQQVQIQTRFSRMMYIALLLQKYTYNDIEDEVLKNSIEWIRSNSVKELGLTFKSGAEVTNDNKEKFIKTMLKDEIDVRRPGYKQVVKGFHAIVSHEILDFTPMELERLLSGVEKVPIEYLKMNAIYRKCAKTTKEIQFFWEILEEESEEYRRKVLLFITGSSTIQQLPRAVNERLVIERVEAKGHLPSAHACFRKLVLYSYATKEELKSKLSYAIEETSGFHFV